MFAGNIHTVLSTVDAVVVFQIPIKCCMFLRFYFLIIFLCNAKEGDYQAVVTDIDFVKLQLDCIGVFSNKLR